MDPIDREAIIALLHAHSVALAALYATHPKPAELFLALIAVEAKSERMAHPAYTETMDMLRKAIPDR